MEFVTEEDGVEYGIKVTYIEEDKNVVFPQSILQKNTQVIPWQCHMFCLSLASNYFLSFIK